jgi:hypothetical protein
MYLIGVMMFIMKFMGNVRGQILSGFSDKWWKEDMVASTYGFIWTLIVKQIYMVLVGIISYKYANNLIDFNSNHKLFYKLIITF